MLCMHSMTGPRHSRNTVMKNIDTRTCKHLRTEIEIFAPGPQQSASHSKQPLFSPNIDKEITWFTVFRKHWIVFLLRSIVVSLEFLESVCVGFVKLLHWRELMSWVRLQRQSFAVSFSWRQLCKNENSSYLFAKLGIANATPLFYPTAWGFQLASCQWAGRTSDLLKCAGDVCSTEERASSTASSDVFVLRIRTKSGHVLAAEAGIEPFSLQWLKDKFNLKVRVWRRKF